MNQPDRYERFVLPPGAKKVEIVRDTRQPNAASFVIEREDHTAGNLVRCLLHHDKDVVFAGYRIPHPLEHKMVVRCQTTGKKTPEQAVDEVLDALIKEFQNLQDQFNEQVSERSMMS